jgi:CheY-like chemotaxis protein
MNKNILIVDDEVSVADFLVELLQIRGYSTEVYYESQKAMEVFLQSPEKYDLVITDQTMPVMTGAELAEKLLSMREDMPIILCTGYSEVVNEEKALGIGISRYMQKPIDIQELLSAVEGLVEA